MNPDSSRHLSLKLNYPNREDYRLAEAAGEKHIEEEFYIHGGKTSYSGMAMGNEAIRELFVLAATVGLENIEVVLCPYDFRDKHRHPDTPISPALQKRYGELEDRLQALGEKMSEK